LEPIAEMNGWVSPLLEIRFQLTENTLEIYRPDGRKFLTPVEMDQLREQERQEKELAQSQAAQERQEKELAQSQAAQERQRAEEAIAQLEQERQRYQALLQQIQQQDINPNPSN
jgi:hypothetical protein